MMDGRSLIRTIIASDPELAACRIVECWTSAQREHKRRVNTIFSPTPWLEITLRPIQVSNGPLNIVAAAFAKKIVQDSAYPKLEAHEYRLSRIVCIGREFISDGSALHAYVGFGYDPGTTIRKPTP